MRRQSPLEEGLHVIRIVRQFHRCRVRQWSARERVQAVGSEQFPDERVFRHRELVTRRKRNGVVIAVEEPLSGCHLLYLAAPPVWAQRTTAPGAPPQRGGKKHGGGRC